MPETHEWVEVDLNAQPGTVEVTKPEDAQSSIPAAPEQKQPPAKVEQAEGGEPSEDDVGKGAAKRIKKLLARTKAAEELAATKAQEAEELKRQLETRGADTERREIAAVGTYKAGVEARLAAAEKVYADAYMAGDTDALIRAQREVNKATFELSQLEQWEVQNRDKIARKPTNPQVPQAQQPQQYVQPQQLPPATVAWLNENAWFGRGAGKDMVATNAAMAISDQMVAEGWDATEMEFYDEVERRLMEELPRTKKLFDRDDTEDQQQMQPQTNRRAPPVAGPSRRPAPSSKVRLTPQEVQTAQRLGVSVEEYARRKLLSEQNVDQHGYSKIF